MAYIGEDELRQRAADFKKTLADTEYMMTENMYRDYLAKYMVWKNKVQQGRLVIHYKPSKHTFSCSSEKMDASVFQELKQLFEGVPALPPQPVQTVATQQPAARTHEKLTAYYEILKKYRTKNFNFRCFADELARCADDDVTRQEILDHSDSFDELERYYNKLMAP